MKPPRGDYTSLEALLLKSSIEAMTFPEYGKVLVLIKLSKKDDSLVGGTFLNWQRKEG